MTDIVAMRAYVDDLELPYAPPVAQDAEDKVPPVVFESVKRQALVVGSEIVSFEPGISAEMRTAISDSALLAQLVAKRKVPDPKDIYKWYDEYFDVLSNVGWVIQDKQFNEYQEDGEGFEVHQAILNVAAVVLGPVPGALAIITGVLNGLQSMNPDSKWITIFNRETKHAESARFQIMMVHNDESDSTIVTLAAFGIKAEASTTQVLFFKWKASEAELRHYSGALSLNKNAVAGVSGRVAERVGAFQDDFFAALPDDLGG